MNIFVLDENPKTAAQYMCDKHVVKMIVESAQLLSMAYPLGRLAREDCPKTKMGNCRKYSMSQLHHPCSKWVVKSLSNWKWLLKHAKELCKEYTQRYGKRHFSERFINWCSENTPLLNNCELTPFAQAMPETYFMKDAVDAYRLYYIYDKSKFAKWERGREAPSWWSYGK